MPKIEPTSKTLVTEYMIQIADINLRMKQMKDSIAVNVLSPDSIQSGDITIGNGNTLTLNTIKNAVIIRSWEPFYLDISTATSQLTDVLCNGLFIFYGELTSVVAKQNIPNTLTRLSYIYS
jgi:hypothetical protein